MLEYLEAFIYDFSGVVATTTLNHSAVLSPHCSVHSASPARTLGVKFFSVRDFWDNDRPAIKYVLGFFHFFHCLHPKRVLSFSEIGKFCRVLSKFLFFSFIICLYLHFFCFPDYIFTIFVKWERDIIIL